ncbi:MAG: M48 family metallopeptidase [Fimbriimonas ginsengisoli]|uniref:M48 family metallopeptidase n=1 Tax=Fimbriimonas ginsengisoli TaxID=1005039 RepID=A0A931LRU4_FIMGI|nr:M48 family metallopeptidase [Fimbriimonas ginsengisoli]
MAKRKILKGLPAEAFVADTDHWALNKLKKVPLLPTVVQKFYEVGLDRWLYCFNMATSVRCGPNQYKTLYEITRESSAILDMPMPEVYIGSNPFPNAFAGGVERPYITLRSSIVETLSDEELYHLIGHELGHIKAGHILYMSVARVLHPLLDLIGRRTFGLGDVASVGLLIALYEWFRQAEISADRAGLLVSQSLDLSLDTNLRMTAGPNRLSHEMNRDAFMDQARAYQEAGLAESLGKVLIFLLMSSMWTHPMPVHRAQELEQWVQAGEYDRVMRGEYARAAAS